MEELKRKRGQGEVGRNDEGSEGKVEKYEDVEEKDIIEKGDREKRKMETGKGKREEGKKGQGQGKGEESRTEGKVGVGM